MGSRGFQAFLSNRSCNPVQSVFSMVCILNKVKHRTIRTLKA